MNDKCGLVNPENPCRCARKTRGFIEAGHVDPENLLFVRERICEVRKAAPRVYEAIKELDDKSANTYRGHPFYQSPDFAQLVRKLVASPALRRATDLACGGARSPMLAVSAAGLEDDPSQHSR